MASRNASRMWPGVLCCLLLMGTLLSGCGRSYQFAGTPFIPALDAPDVVGVVGAGSEFSLRELPQKVKLVFFGYTSCPDICPLTLGNLNSVYGSLSDVERDDVAVVLISLDPARDTPDRLAAYVSAFDPEFFAVHIAEERLTPLLAEFNVFSGKRSLPGDSDRMGYLIDHTSVIFVIDRDDKLREIFPSNAPADQVAADVRYLLSE